MWWIESYNNKNCHNWSKQIGIYIYLNNLDCLSFNDVDLSFLFVGHN